MQAATEAVKTAMMEVREAKTPVSSARTIQAILK